MNQQVIEWVRRNPNQTFVVLAVLYILFGDQLPENFTVSQEKLKTAAQLVAAVLIGNGIVRGATSIAGNSPATQLANPVTNPLNPNDSNLDKNNPTS